MVMGKSIRRKCIERIGEETGLEDSEEERWRGRTGPSDRQSDW